MYEGLLILNEVQLKKETINIRLLYKFKNFSAEFYFKIFLIQNELTLE